MKIANEEDVPKKIKYNNCIFEITEGAGIRPDYVNEENEFFLEYVSNEADSLNEIVEIIEEDKPIEKLELEEANNKVALKTDSGDYNVRMIDVNVILKLNEIIDKLNELSKKVE